MWNDLFTVPSYGKVVGCFNRLEPKLGSVVAQSDDFAFKNVANEHVSVVYWSPSPSMSSPPSYYDVINQKASAFIAKPDCQYHVSLLHTFHQLRISDPEAEKVYLARAEARYFLWMNHVQSYEPSNYLLPPIGKLSTPTPSSSVFNEY